VETYIFNTETDSTSSPSKVLDSCPQNSIYSKNETEPKNLLKKSTDSIVKPTANNLNKIKKEEAEIEEFEELKDCSPDDLLPSNLKFKIIEETKLRGSSPELKMVCR